MLPLGFSCLMVSACFSSGCCCLYCPSRCKVDVACHGNSQTLDALDGKQSYKTQCSEIEEFTDHGADSLSTMFMAMMLASAFKMGSAFPNLLIPLFTGCLVALYTTHSVSYFTHSCVFEK